MQAFLKDDKVIIEGKGIEFLRFKSVVTKIVGVNFIHSEGKETFSIARDAASAIDDLLSDLGVQNFVSDVHKHKIAREQVLRIFEEQESILPPPWDTTLKPYQLVAVKAMIVPGLAGLCLFDEPGTGKTVMSISAFDLLYKNAEIQTALVICPKSVFNAWEHDFKKFAPTYDVITVSGTKIQKIGSLFTKHDIYILNYESVLSLFITLRALIQSRKCLLIVDESFFVKNSNALRSKKLRELRNDCRRAFVLCGTPAPNNAIDLINQFNMADDGYTFRGFVQTGDSTHDAGIISHQVSERGVFLRRLKDQILPGLPMKKFEIIETKMEGSQLRLYNRAKESLVLYLRTMDNEMLQKDLTNYMAKRSILLQICSCPSDKDPLFTGSHAKLKILDELIEDLIIKKGRKVIIWSFYRYSIAEITRRYKNYGLVKIDGQTLDNERKNAIRKFQEDEGIKIFVGNPAAAGAGITLHAAADNIFISLSNQAAHFLQALDRTHRIGQTSDQVRYYIIICKDTIEKSQIQILRMKEMSQHKLFYSEGDFPSTLEDAFAELEEELGE